MGEVTGICWLAVAGIRARSHPLRHCPGAFPLEPRAPVHLLHVIDSPFNLIPPLLLQRPSRGFALIRPRPARRVRPASRKDRKPSGSHLFNGLFHNPVAVAAAPLSFDDGFERLL